MIVRQFGVTISDNDYHRTFEAALTAIASSLVAQEITKEQLFSAIKDSAYGFYRATQGLLSSEESHLATARHFESRLKPDKLFVNEELDSFLDSEGWFNCELFCVTVPGPLEPSFIKPYFWVV